MPLSLTKLKTPLTNQQAVNLSHAITFYKHALMGKPTRDAIRHNRRSIEATVSEVKDTISDTTAMLDTARFEAMKPFVHLTPEGTIIFGENNRATFKSEDAEQAWKVVWAQFKIDNKEHYDFLKTFGDELTSIDELATVHASDLPDIEATIEVDDAMAVMIAEG